MPEATPLWVPILIPLLIGLEVPTGVGADVAGVALSATTHQQLSEEILEGLNKSSYSIIDLQRGPSLE